MAKPMFLFALILQTSGTVLPDPLGLFSGIGSGEVIIILIVLLLLFGPKQLPEFAKSIGSALRRLRKATDDIKEELGLEETISALNRPIARDFKPEYNPPPSPHEGQPEPVPPTSTTLAPTFDQTVAHVTSDSESRLSSQTSTINSSTCLATADQPSMIPGDRQSTRPSVAPSDVADVLTPSPDSSSILEPKDD